MATNNDTAPKGDTTEFQDKDLEKTLMDSPLLEDLGMGGNDSTAPSTEAAAEATPPASDATPPTGEAVPPTDGTPTDTPADAAASTEAAANETGDATPSDAASEDDDIMKIIEQIKTGDDAVAAASDKVDEAIESGNQEDIKAAYEALKVEKQQQDEKVNNLMKELDRKNSDIAGLIDDKMTIEQSNKEKSRIADVVMDSDDLKSLVAFTNKAQSDESYKSKVVAVLERMWEKYTGQSIDELKDAERVATKSQM